MVGGTLITALTITAQTEPDVVLMDVRMPGIDGIEATRRLRATTDAERPFRSSRGDQARVTR